MATLETSRFFRQINAADLATLTKVAPEQHFAPGQEIFKEGDRGDGVYVVKSGLVEISALVAENVRHVFSKVGAGDIFGEMAVIEDKPRSASATARDASTVYFIPRAEMLSLMEKSPKLSLEMLREISRRLREFDRQYLSEVIQTERLAVVGRFARSIVHDLKNPLNIIGITAELAGMATATPEMKQQAPARIRKQVDRISEMVGEILDFTQGTHSEFVLAPTDYRALVEQIIEELTPEVALKLATLQLTPSTDTAHVLVNPKRLRRVFFNLIHNATDAMPGGGKITVRLRLKSHEIVTEIADTGSGIAPAIAGQLFEAFATHGKEHGTGLGLSICKRIVEDHHGWIAARNEPGQGAVFSFGLPRQEPSTGT